jgi:hypothetical protein
VGPTRAETRGGRDLTDEQPRLTDFDDSPEALPLSLFEPFRGAAEPDAKPLFTLDVNFPGKCHPSFPAICHPAWKNLTKTSPGSQDEASNPGAALRAVEGRAKMAMRRWAPPRTDCQVSAMIQALQAAGDERTDVRIRIAVQGPTSSLGNVCSSSTTGGAPVLGPSCTCTLLSINSNSSLTPARET